MEAWVEEGRAPDRLAAAHPDALPGPPGAPPRASTPYTRPLCPYPSRAQYRDGDEAAAASYECVWP